MVSLSNNKLLASSKLHPLQGLQNVEKAFLKVWTTSDLWIFANPWNWFLMTYGIRSDHEARVKCKKAENQFTRKRASVTRSVGSRSRDSLQGNRNEKFPFAWRVVVHSTSLVAESLSRILFIWIFHPKMQLDEVNDSWLELLRYLQDNQKL